MHAGGISFFTVFENGACDMHAPRIFTCLAPVIGCNASASREQIFVHRVLFGYGPPTRFVSKHALSTSYFSLYFIISWISIENKWLLLPDKHPSLGKHMLYNTPGERQPEAIRPCLYIGWSILEKHTFPTDK